MQHTTQEIKTFQITGIILALVIIPTTLIFYFLGKGNNTIPWILLGVLALLISVLSIYVEFFKKNIENMFYIWVTLGLCVVYYDLYTSDLNLVNGLITPTAIYLTANIHFKKPKNYLAIMSFGFILHMFVSYSFFVTQPADAIIFFIFGIIAILTSIFYVRSRYNLINSNFRQSLFPDYNPNGVIEIDNTGEVNYVNPASIKIFPNIKKLGSKHPLFFKFAEFSRLAKSSDNNQYFRRLKIGKKSFEQKIVYVPDLDSFRIYFSDVTELSKTSLVLRKTQEELEKKHHALMNLLDDMSAEKDYEAVRNKILIENINEAILLTNESGEITYANDIFYSMFQLKEDDVMNKDITEVISAYDLNDKAIDPLLLSNSAAVTSNENSMKLKMERGDGQKISVNMRSAPVKVQDKFKGVIRVIHDISEDVKLAQQKDDFFSMASHELRTPLTVISGNIDIILQGYSNSKLSKDDKELLQDTLSASDRLIRMVNDFLNVSRLDQGRLQYELVELNPCDIAKSVVKEVKPLADEKGVDLIYKCDKKHANVMADEGFLKEIIINLTGNSIKFTSVGSVTVSTSVENGQVNIRVTDSGIGIQKDKQDKLFARFQQAMNKTLAREAGGTGLGLYISREFARKMGGDLILEKSVYKKGSTFKLSLPAVEVKNKKTKTKKTSKSDE